MAIFPYQDDLRTDNLSFTDATSSLVEPVAFSPRPRALRLTGSLTLNGALLHFADTTTSANFSVVFYENTSSFFDVIYGATSDSGLDETSGVQASASGPATTFSCGTATLTPGLKVTYNCAGGGGSPTPTPTATGTPSGGCVIMGSIDPSDPTQSRSTLPQRYSANLSSEHDMCDLW